MEVFSHLRSLFRGRPNSGSMRANNNNNNCSPSMDKNNNNNNNHSVSKKRVASVCDICGKRLLKLPGWRNYFVLPCRSRHVFCKQCITERLECRQKVMRSVSFDLIWTFPCPGSAQCGQELSVKWSRGSSYSRNLVARDLGSSEDSLGMEHDEEDEEEEEEDEVMMGSEEEGPEGDGDDLDVSMYSDNDVSLCSKVADVSAGSDAGPVVAGGNDVSVASKTGDVSVYSSTNDASACSKNDVSMYSSTSDASACSKNDVSLVREIG